MLKKWKSFNESVSNRQRVIDETTADLEIYKPKFEYDDVHTDSEECESGRMDAPMVHVWIEYTGVDVTDELIKDVENDFLESTGHTSAEILTTDNSITINVEVFY